MANTATLLQAVFEHQVILEASRRNADLGAIGSEFVKALNPSNRSDQAIMDIRELSKIAEEIKQAFHDIGLHFLEFDNANFQDNEGRVLNLGGRWRVYQIRFQTMLDKSFDNASAASAFMQQYSEAVMTDVAQASYVSLRGEIQMFVKRLETKAEDALRTKNEFTGLAYDVRLLTKAVAESLVQVDARVMKEVNVTRQELDLLHQASCNLLNNWSV